MQTGGLTGHVVLGGQNGVVFGTQGVVLVPETVGAQRCSTPAHQTPQSGHLKGAIGQAPTGEGTGGRARPDAQAIGTLS